MTELEWQKYVEKLARKIKTPRAAIDTEPIAGTYSWKTSGVWSTKVKNIVNREAPIVKYETREYVFKGKKFKREFIK